MYKLYLFSLGKNKYNYISKEPVKLMTNILPEDYNVEKFFKTSSG